MMLDALTRASFTGFPTAFVGFLLVSTALAAATSADRDGESRRPPSSVKGARTPRRRGSRGVGRLGPRQQMAP